MSSRVQKLSNALKCCMQAYYDANISFDGDLPAGHSRSQLLTSDWPNKGHPIDQSVNWCPNLKVPPLVALFTNG